MSEPHDEEATSDELAGYDLCYCGCTRAEHNAEFGNCEFCGECEKFEYDHDSTCIALASPDPEDRT